MLVIFRKRDSKHQTEDPYKEKDTVEKQNKEVFS